MDGILPSFNFLLALLLFWRNYLLEWNSNKGKKQTDSLCISRCDIWRIAYTNCVSNERRQRKKGIVGFTRVCRIHFLCFASTRMKNLAAEWRISSLPNWPDCRRGVVHKSKSVDRTNRSFIILATYTFVLHSIVNHRTSCTHGRAISCCAKGLVIIDDLKNKIEMKWNGKIKKKDHFSRSDFELNLSVWETMHNGTKRTCAPGSFFVCFRRKKHDGAGTILYLALLFTLQRK